MKQASLLGLLVLSVWGCGGENGGVNADAKPDGGKTCTADTQCTSPQVCDVQGTKTCVECTVEKDSACTGGKPVCGEDHACRACAAHSECDSGVCLGDGTCAAENTVAYVNGGMGSDAADCNKNTPCKTLGKALGTMRGVVKVSGTTVESGKVNIGRAVKVVGDSGIVTGQAEPLLDVQSGGQLELVGLEVKPDGAFAPAACLAIGTGSTGKLVLVNTKVTRCGVLSTSSSGTVTVTGSTISGNTAGPGLSATGGTVTVTGSTFRSNAGGGLKVENAAFKITNNIIVQNGSGASAVGGARLAPVAGMGSEFAFNTVLENTVFDDMDNGGGVKCVGASVVLDNNIIAANLAGTKTTLGHAQTAGSCTYGKSVRANELDSLKFKNTTTMPTDYHLTAASPATVRNVAGVSNCSGVDIDGDARPQEGACDLGADEYKP